MRIKGAFHIHSKLSRDGTMTISELAAWYGQKGYHFLAMAEHAEDLSEMAVQVLIQQSAENSTSHFCVLPGIEFACGSDMHIVGLGTPRLIPGDDHLAVIRQIHEEGGFAVLAHPKRLGWKCAPEILRAVDAIEIWNVGYDGKYLPWGQAVAGMRRAQQVNPDLLALPAHDFHRKESFYDVAIEMEVSSLTAKQILRNLWEGSYNIRSCFFRCDARGRVSWPGALSLRLLGGQLGNLRKARARFWRWVQ